MVQTTWHLLTWGGSEGGNGRLETQHLTDHRSVHSVKAVVAHGAPDAVVLHLYSPLMCVWHKSHVHCLNKKS